eukprot:GFYU01009410.1.p1 GENE.GFYU01009410.1~~GFYU01009410.1.p1  ORF type:complete len:1299 (+),score=360.00 GFYU01009410.1:281-4177(+)
MLSWKCGAAADSADVEQTDIEKFLNDGSTSTRRQAAQHIITNRKVWLSLKEKTSDVEYATHNISTIVFLLQDFQADEKSYYTPVEVVAGLIVMLTLQSFDDLRSLLIECGCIPAVWPLLCHENHDVRVMAGKVFAAVFHGQLRDYEVQTGTKAKVFHDAAKSIIYYLYAAAGGLPTVDGKKLAAPQLPPPDVGIGGSMFFFPKLEDGLLQTQCATHAIYRLLNHSPTHWIALVTPDLIQSLCVILQVADEVVRYNGLRCMRYCAGVMEAHEFIVDLNVIPVLRKQLTNATLKVPAASVIYELCADKEASNHCDDEMTQEVVEVKGLVHELKTSLCPDHGQVLCSIYGLMVKTELGRKEIIPLLHEMILLFPEDTKHLVAHVVYLAVFEERDKKDMSSQIKSLISKLEGDQYLGNPKPGVQTAAGAALANCVVWRWNQELVDRLIKKAEPDKMPKEKKGILQALTTIVSASTVNADRVVDTSIVNSCVTHLRDPELLNSAALLLARVAASPKASDAVILSKEAIPSVVIMLVHNTKWMRESALSLWRRLTKRAELCEKVLEKDIMELIDGRIMSLHSARREALLALIAVMSHSPAARIKLLDHVWILKKFLSGMLTTTPELALASSNCIHLCSLMPEAIGTLLDLRLYRAMAKFVSSALTSKDYSVETSEMIAFRFINMCAFGLGYKVEHVDATVTDKVIHRRVCERLMNHATLSTLRHLIDRSFDSGAFARLRQQRARVLDVLHKVLSGFSRPQLATINATGARIPHSLISALQVMWTSNKRRGDKEHKELVSRVAHLLDDIGIEESVTKLLVSSTNRHHLSWQQPMSVDERVRFGEYVLTLTQEMRSCDGWAMLMTHIRKALKNSSTVSAKLLETVLSVGIDATTAMAANSLENNARDREFAALLLGLMLDIDEDRGFPLVMSNSVLPVLRELLDDADGNVHAYALFASGKVLQHCVEGTTTLRASIHEVLGQYLGDVLLDNLSYYVAKSSAATTTPSGTTASLAMTSHVVTRQPSLNANGNGGGGGDNNESGTAPWTPGYTPEMKLGLASALLGFVSHAIGAQFLLKKFGLYATLLSLRNLLTQDDVQRIFDVVTAMVTSAVSQKDPGKISHVDDLNADNSLRWIMGAISRSQVDKAEGLAFLVTVTQLRVFQPALQRHGVISYLIRCLEDANWRTRANALMALESYLHSDDTCDKRREVIAAEGVQGVKSLCKSVPRKGPSGTHSAPEDGVDVFAAIRNAFLLLKRLVEIVEGSETVVRVNLGAAVQNMMQINWFSRSVDEEFRQLAFEVTLSHV